MSAACADTVVWTGEAGDNEWSSALNWKPIGVPQATDKVVFSNEMTVAVVPPADFSGRLIVASNTTLTVTIDNDVPVFSVGVAQGGKLIKAGGGSVKLRPVAGYYPGDIEVAAGAVTFAGNGPTEPAGLFGRLVVKSGASVSVADSPFATRHAGFTCGGYLENRTSEMTKEEFLAHFPQDYAAYAASFETKSLVSGELYTLVDTPEIGDTFWTGEQCLPDELKGKDYFVVWSRGIVLVESESRLSYSHSGDNWGRHFLDEGAMVAFSAWTGGTSTSVTRPAGWHAYDHVVVEGGGTFKLGATRTAVGVWDDGKFGPNALWFGICFNSIAAESGATLEIPAGQAVGIGCGHQLALEGATLLGTGCLSVMGAASQVDLSQVRAFAGQVELGAGVTALTGGDASANRWTVFGCGTLKIDNGSEALFDDSFAGTIDIPAGVSFNLKSALMPAQVTGSGTLAVSNPEMLARLVSFSGKLLVENGLQGKLPALGFLQRRNVVLGDGTKLVFPAGALASGFFEPIPSWSVTENCWTLNGASTAEKSAAEGKGEVLISQSPPSVEAETGDLLLTDDAAQCHTAVYTNRTFSISDEWELSFSLSMGHPADNKWKAAGYTQYFAEGFSFVIQADGPTAYQKSSNARPASSCGFFLYAYDQNIQFIEDATAVGPAVKASTVGLNVREKLDVHVSGDGPHLLVTLSQNGKSYSFTRDLTAFFSKHPAGYLTMVSQSGHWGLTNSGVPWIETRLSGFSGRARCGRRVEKPFPGDLSPITSEKWKLLDDASLDAETGVLRVSPANVNAKGAAHCKTPLASFRVPFKATYAFDAISGGFSSKAEGLAFVLQADGLDVHANPGDLGFMGDTENAFGIAFHAYENTSAGVVDGKAWVNQWRPSEWISFSTKISGFASLDYDGCGSLAYSIAWTNENGVGASLSGTYTAKETFARLADKPMYLSFFSSGPSWNATCAFDVRDFRLLTFENVNAPIGGALWVSDDAATTLAFGGYSPVESSVATLDDIVLGSNASLTLEPELLETAVTVHNLTVGGTAAVRLAPQTSLTLDGATFTGASPTSLAVSGDGSFAYGESLTFVVPSAWRAGMNSPFRLIDLSGVDAPTVVPAAVRLLDENGKACRSPWVRFDERGVWLVRPGFYFICR